MRHLLLALRLLIGDCVEEAAAATAAAAADALGPALTVEASYACRRVMRRLHNLKCRVMLENGESWRMIRLI